MTGRDRIVVIAIALLLVLGAGWLLVVSPERKQAATLDAQVSTARAQLASAKTQVANASGAQAKYESAYTSIVSLGKAVPASQEVPSLMYQIAQATHQKHVEFQSITSGNGSSGPGSTPTAAAAAAVASPMGSPPGADADVIATAGRGVAGIGATGAGGLATRRLTGVSAVASSAPASTSHANVANASPFCMPA